MVPTGVIESLIASFVFQFTTDTAKRWGIDHNNRSFQNNLKQTLRAYVEAQQKKYRDEWEFIEDCTRKCVRLEDFFDEVCYSGANEDYLLRMWMTRYTGAQQYRPYFEDFCKGLIDCLLSAIYNNSEKRQDLHEGITEDTHFRVLQVESAVAREHVRAEARHQEFMQAVSYSKQPEEHVPITVKDRTKNYKEIWNLPLFLNDGRRDRNVSTVCLKDVHIPHQYLFGTEKHTANEAKYPLLEELATPGGHLVLGDPGIGKSSLISRFINERGDSRKILVYQMTDFELSGQVNHPGDALLYQMGICQNELTNLILFLDGLDECGLTPEDRVGFLRRLNTDWLTMKKNGITWVVTCRLNYIPEKEIASLPIPRVTLLPLEPEHIDAFLNHFEDATKQHLSDEKRSALKSTKHKGTFGSPFGIPLILYMVVASDNVSVKEGSTLVDVYDQLFPDLYKRRYDTLEQKPISEDLRNEVHQMSRDIALWMLLHNSDKATIPEKAYQEIEGAFSDKLKKDHAHLIRSYFRDLRHTEGTEELCFVHRTMYEYFVADGFVHLAVSAQSPEELSRVIAWFWHKNEMGNIQQKYVQEKLNKFKGLLDFSLWEAAGRRIIEKGFYRCLLEIPNGFLGRAKWQIPDCLFPLCGNSLRDDRQAENTTFWNLCHLLLWVRDAVGYAGLVFTRTSAVKSLARTIRHCAADHYHIYCPSFTLSSAGLAHTNLSHALLSNANLHGAHLSGADLSAADLTGANLTNITIVGANLTSTLLSPRQVKMIGYEKLATCRFSKIKIGTSATNHKDYTRPRFFNHFSPKKPYPGNID